MKTRSFAEMQAIIFWASKRLFAVILVSFCCFVLFQSYTYTSVKKLTMADSSKKALAVVRFIARNRDDIAWENDRIAFRIYGPALERREPTGSGIDVWAKSVRYPVIDKWYAGGDYDNDHGEGLDFYGVGHSRGCGGLGVWDGQTLSTSGHWASYRIKKTDGHKAVFKLDYLPWQLPGGRPVGEHRTITLVKGTNLNRL